jgi:hypothetical protein
MVVSVIGAAEDGFVALRMSESPYATSCDSSVAKPGELPVNGELLVDAEDSLPLPAIAEWRRAAVNA